jgi:hypothetical protein
MIPPHNSYVLCVVDEKICGFIQHHLFSQERRLNDYWSIKGNTTKILKKLIWGAIYGSLASLGV